MNSTHPETSKEDVSEPEDGEILDEGEEEDEKLVVQGRRNPPYSRNAYHYRRRSGRRARKNGHSHDTRQNRRLRNNNNNHSRKADEQENTSPGDYLHYLVSFGRRNKLISEKRLSSSSKGSEGEPRTSRDISRSSGKRDDHKGKELASARVGERHSRTSSTSGRIVKPNKSPVKQQSHSKPGTVTGSSQNEKQQSTSAAPSSSASPNFDVEVKSSNPIPNASANTEDVSADEMEDDEDSAPSIQILSDDGENEKTAPEIITLDATDSSDGEHGHHATSPKKPTSGVDGFGEDVDGKKVDSDDGSSTDFEVSGIASEPENENEHNEKQVEPNISCTIPRDDVVTNKVSSPIIQSVNFDSSDILDVDGKHDLMHVNTDTVKEVLENELDLGVEKDSHLSDEEIDVLELRNKLLSELVSKTDASEVQIKDQDVMKECISNISVKIINDIDTSSPSTIHTNKLPEHDNNEEEEAEALRAVVLSLLSKKKSNQRPSSPPPANSIPKKGLSTVVNDKLQQERRGKSRTGSSDHDKEDSRRSSTESQLSGASRGSSRRRSNNSSDRSNRARSPPSKRRRGGKVVGDRKNSPGNDDYSKTRDTRHRPTAPISVKSNERISVQNRSRAATLSPPLNRDASPSQNPALHNTNSNESFLSTHTVKDLPENDLRKQLLKHTGGGVGPQKRTCITDHQIAPTTSSNYDSVLESGNKRRREEEETIFRRIVNFSNEGSQTENVSATSITWTEPLVTAASHPNDTVLSTHQSVTPTCRHDVPPFTSSTFASSQASNDHQRLATSYATQNPNPRLPFEAPSVFTRLTAPGHLGFNDIAANPSQFPTHLHQSGSNATLQQLRLNVPPLMSALPQDSSFLVTKTVPTIQSFGISDFAPRQGVRNVAPIPNISGNQTEFINAPPPNAWDWRSGGTSGIRNNLRFEGAPLINTNNTGNISSLGKPRITTTNTSTLIQVPLSKTIAAVSSTVKATSLASIKTTEETTQSSKKAHLNKSKTGKGKTLSINKEGSTSSNKSFPNQKQQLIVKVPQQPPSTNKSSSKSLPRIVIPVRDNDSTSDEMEDADDQGLRGDAPPMGNEFQKKLDELLKRAREASESKITEKENEKQLPTESTPAHQQTSEQEDNASISQPSTCDKPTMPSKVIEEELPRTLTMTSTSSSSASSKTPLLSSITKKSAKPDVPKQSIVNEGLGSILQVVQSVPPLPSGNEATLSRENPTTSKAPLVTKPLKLQMQEIKVPAAPVPITIDLNKKPLKRPASPIASKKIIEDLTKKVAESNNLLSLSAKEKELLNSRQSCFTELREIQKSLQQHTRLRNLDAKFESEIASVQKKLDQLKSKQQSVRSKASDVNQFIKEKSKLVLPLKANCISLERDVHKLGSKIFGAKSYKVTDLFRKDIDTIVKEISVLNARQPNNFILERGVVFHQVISDIDPTSTLRTSNSDLANLDFSTIAKGKDHPKSKQPASSTTTVSGDIVQTASKKTDGQNRLYTLNKKSTVSKTDQTSIINKNDDSKNRQDVGGISIRSATDDAKSSNPDPEERPIFLTRHGLSDSKSDGMDQKHSDSFVYYSHGFVRGDVLGSSKKIQSLAVFPYVSILTGYFSTSLDPNLQLCSKGLEGGVCLTADCSYLHIE